VPDTKKLTVALISFFTFSPLPGVLGNSEQLDKLKNTCENLQDIFFFFAGRLGAEGPN
jgi:hypothetical protein